MDIDRLKSQLTVDEGCRHTVYLDTMDLPTVGIGHLVLEHDHLNVGDTITQARCDELFNADLQTAIDDARRVVSDFDTLPDPIQEVIVNLSFALGAHRLSEFQKMLAAISNKDWIRMADEICNSTWYTKVGQRGERLVESVLDYYESTIDQIDGEVMA